MFLIKKKCSPLIFNALNNAVVFKKKIIVNKVHNMINFYFLYIKVLLLRYKKRVYEKIKIYVRKQIVLTL